VVQSQPRQIVCEALSQKYPSHKGLAEWLKVKVLSLSHSTEQKIQIPSPTKILMIEIFQGCVLEIKIFSKFDRDLY
jgi:hypothetical protein